MLPNRVAADSLAGRGFLTTHWTLVETAARNDAAANEARNALCRDYWYPIYAYVRRLGHRDPEDITQDFLTDILRRNWLAQADPHRGKFRSFLLSSLNNFLHDLDDRRKALKRGGAYLRVPLDMADAESRYGQGRSDGVPPADVYELEWAAAIVTAAFARLEAEYAADNQQTKFEILRVFLKVPGDVVRYQVAATELGAPVGTVKSLVSRLRHRYAAILREEVVRTVASGDDVNSEMQHLRNTLATQMSA